MNNATCRECSTVKLCAARGCIPVTQYDASVSAESRRRWFAIGSWLGVAALFIFCLAASAGLFTAR